MYMYRYIQIHIDILSIRLPLGKKSGDEIIFSGHGSVYKAKKKANMV